MCVMVGQIIMATEEVSCGGSVLESFMSGCLESTLVSILYAMYSIYSKF